MPHSRKSSGGASQHRPRRPSASQPTPPKHHRTHTAPDPPSLLRLPSAAATAPSASPRLRRATVTDPSTPTAPYPASPAASATSASYFAPQTTAAQDPRSPGARRPPASHSAHGIDNSRGPPVTLVTRGNSDIARRTQPPPDAAFAQQQLLQAGLVSPGASQGPSRRRESLSASEAPPKPQPNPPARARHSTASTARAARPAPPMASSSEDSSSESESDVGPRSRLQDFRAAHSRQGAHDNSGTDSEHAEDLFMNIAADSAPKARPVEAPARIDRLKVSSSRNGSTAG